MTFTQPTGASFESARNLLIHEDVREIILVAIGTFQQPYNKEDYKITGNVYEPGANYSLIGEKTIYGKGNEKSSEIINKIYDPFQKLVQVIPLSVVPLIILPFILSYCREVMNKVVSYREAYQEGIWSSKR